MVLMMGRTKTYDREPLVQAILARYAAGETLRAICRDDPEGPAPSTVRLWAIKDDPPGFAEQYARAREMHADAIIEQAFDIADDSSRDTVVDDEGRERQDHEWVNRSRLRVDTRKWAAAKLWPRKYGDKLDMTSDGEKVSVAVVVRKE